MAEAEAAAEAAWVAATAEAATAALAAGAEAEAVASKATADAATAEAAEAAEEVAAVAQPAAGAAVAAEPLNPSRVLTRQPPDDEWMTWAKRCFEHDDTAYRKLASFSLEVYAMNIFTRQLHETDGRYSMSEADRRFRETFTQLDIEQKW